MSLCFLHGKAKPLPPDEPVKTLQVIASSKEVKKVEVAKPRKRKPRTPNVVLT